MYIRTHEPPEDRSLPQTLIVELNGTIALFIKSRYVGIDFPSENLISSQS